MTESSQFEQRKKDHIRWSLDEKTQATELSGWHKYELIHEALPEFNFSDTNLEIENKLGYWQTPFFVSSMTAGHSESLLINQRLAFSSVAKGWPMAVGSQRKELTDSLANHEWSQIRKSFPTLKMIGNIGVAQLNEFGPEKILALIDNAELSGFFIHLNPLQEALQTEGTPFFEGSLRNLEQLVKRSTTPILIKEVGCGINLKTIRRLESIGIQIVDVSGTGGTHWGRVEVQRQMDQSNEYKIGKAFWGWGQSTADILSQLSTVKLKTEIWGSGGVRSGVHALKALAFGARAIGIAQPLMQAAVHSENQIIEVMSGFEKELRIAMFCCGVKSLIHDDLKSIIKERIV